MITAAFWIGNQLFSRSRGFRYQGTTFTTDDRIDLDRLEFDLQQIMLVNISSPQTLMNCTLHLQNWSKIWFLQDLIKTQKMTKKKDMIFQDTIRSQIKSRYIINVLPQAQLLLLSCLYCYITQGRCTNRVHPTVLGVNLDRNKTLLLTP